MRPVPMIASALIASTLAGTAQAYDFCDVEEDIYRSLVIHGTSSTNESVEVTAELPYRDEMGVIASTTVTDQPIPFVNTGDPAYEEFWETFSIENTLTRIAETSLLGQSATPEEIADRVESLKSSFLGTQSGSDAFFTAVDGNGEAITNPFHLDGGSAVDLEDLEPVSIFNRIDALDADGETCGEHRIVYAQGTTKLVIFEAQIPNPNPEIGRAGCLPLLGHWLEAADKNVADGSLAEHMAELFYVGVGDFESAIHIDHLGGTYGQVRGNAVLGWSSDGWSLREWRIRPSATDGGQGQPVFEIDTVKNNALAELFNPEGTGVPSTIDLSSAANPATAWENFQGDFLTHWEEDLVPALKTPDSMEVEGFHNNGLDFVHLVRGGVAPEFNEYQSIAGFGTLEFISDVDDTASAIADAIPGSVDDQHVYNRYVFGVTCAGCHFTPTNWEDRQIYTDAAWPKSGSFTHAAGNGNLSEGLHGTFLPKRAQLAETMLAEDRLEGDLDLDGMVGTSDLLVLLTNFGTDGRGDEDCSGAVGVSDILTFLQNYGASLWPEEDDGGVAPESSTRAAAADNLADLADLKDSISRTPVTSTAVREALIEDIRALQDTIRSEEKALLDIDGLPRQTH